MSAKDRLIRLSLNLRHKRGWRKLRKQHLFIEPYCRMCGTKKKLEVHHRLPQHLFPERALKRDNLITLCRDDHFRYGHWNNFRAYNPMIESLCVTVEQVRQKHPSPV